MASSFSRCHMCLARRARPDGYCCDECATRAARPAGNDVHSRRVSYLAEYKNVPVGTRARPRAKGIDP